MANLRNLKKEIDYRLEEFVFDCEMAIYFQPNKEDEVVKLMEKAVELRNALYVKANNPDEPKNASLVREVLCCNAPRYGRKFRRTLRRSERPEQIIFSGKILPAVGNPDGRFCCLYKTRTSSGLR